MKLVGFFPLALNRLRSRLFLSLLLVLTTALTLGVTVGIPVFAGAVSRRILQEEISARSRIRGWPIFSVRISAQPTPQSPMGLEGAIVARDWLKHALRDAVDLPITSEYVELQSPMYRLAPVAGDTTYTTEYLAGVQVVHVDHVKEHIDVLEGNPFGQIGDPSELSVWVERSFAEELVIEVGEEYILGELYSSHGDTLPVRIAGFWKAADPADHFWPQSPEGHFDSTLLVTDEQFSAFVSNELEEQANLISWYFVFDDQRLNLDRAEDYIDGLNLVMREAESRLPAARMDLDPMEDLLRGQRRKISLSIVMFGFSIPVLVILAYFLASLSATQTRFQEDEIAMIISRGGTTWQMLGVAVVESLIIVAAALPIGLLLALAMSYLLGFSTGFLSFAIRDPMHVSLYSIDWQSIAVVVGVSLIIRVRATWRASRATIISHERGRTRQLAVLGATRLLFVAVMVLFTVYAYRQLSNRGTLLLASLDTLDPRNDPLILLAPTLFIFAAPLIASEIFVWLMVPLDWIGRFLPWISGYLASMNLSRSGGQYRAPTYRLILCLSLGVFYASIAKSADIWLVDSKRYEYGADLTFKLGEAPKGEFAAWDTSPEEAVEIPLIPADTYREIEGVRAAARVGDFQAKLRAGRNVPYVRLLAIDRLDFPQVAYFRGDYATESLGELMNRLATSPEGVLLSSSLARQLVAEEGDSLQINVNVYEDMWLQFEAQVVGFFDYFPTMYVDEAPVLVCNLNYLELYTIGALPHDVWLTLEPGADSEAVIDDVRRLQVKPKSIQDLHRTLQTESRRLERVGVFGLLSFCFVAGAVLSVADLVVYSTAMLRERSIRHAVLRALGLQRPTVMNVVMVEGIVSVSYGLALGIICGVACAKLYVPYFPLTNVATVPIPPFIPFVDWIRTGWIAGTMALALLATELLVLVRMTRARVFEVLRLGNRP